MPGIDEDDVDVDYDAKIVTVRLDDEDAPSAEELVGIFEGTRYTAKIVK